MVMGMTLMTPQMVVEVGEVQEQWGLMPLLKLLGQVALVLIGTALVLIMLVEVEVVKVKAELLLALVVMAGVAQVHLVTQQPRLLEQQILVVEAVAVQTVLQLRLEPQVVQVL